VRSVDDSNSSEDEVELIDLLRTIWARRYFIILTTLSLILIAGVGMQMLPKKYETTALIQIGRVWEKEIENPYLTREWMGSDAFLLRIIEKLNLNITPQEMREKKRIQAEVLESGPSGKKVPLLLSLRVQGEVPQQTVKIAETVSRFLIEKHHARFQERLQEHQVYEESLTQNVAQIETAIRGLEVLIEKQQMKPVVNAPSVILLQSQLEQKNVQLLEFKRELKDTRINNNSKIITENTRLIAAPIIPTKPVGPRIFLFSAVAGVLGFFSALCLAFFLEYLKQVRSSELESINLRKKKREKRKISELM